METLGIGGQVPVILTVMTSSGYGVCGSAWLHTRFLSHPCCDLNCWNAQARVSSSVSKARAFFLFGVDVTVE